MYAHPDYARCVLNVIRMMRYGECPRCSRMDKITAFHAHDGETGELTWQCPACDFTIAVADFENAKEDFAWYQHAQLTAFNQWRETRKKVPPADGELAPDEARDNIRKIDHSWLTKAQKRIAELEVAQTDHRAIVTKLQDELTRARKRVEALERVDWRIGMAVTPKLRSHRYYMQLAVVRKVHPKVEDTAMARGKPETIEVEFYGSAGAAWITEPSVDWMTA